MIARIVAIGVPRVVRDACAMRRHGSRTTRGTLLVALFAAGCATSAKPQAANAPNELSTSGMHRVALIPSGQGALLVPVTIHGREVVLLVDTGAQSTVLDIATATSLGIRSSESSNFSMGIGAGRVAIRQGESTTFTIGGFDASVAPTLQDFSNITRNALARGGRPIVGLLGFDVLKTYGALLDVDRGVLWLRKPT